MSRRSCAATAASSSWATGVRDAAFRIGRERERVREHERVRGHSGRLAACAGAPFGVAGQRDQDRRDRRGGRGDRGTSGRHENRRRRRP